MDFFHFSVCLVQLTLRALLTQPTCRDAGRYLSDNAVKLGVRTESLRGLHYLFATQAELERSEFKALLSAGGLGDRLGTAQVSALLKRGLLATDSPHGKLRLGVPQHALRFYFPNLWPEAEMDGR